MIGDCISPISKVSAGDILKELFRNDSRFQRIPTAEDAERIASELMAERGLFVRPAYLLDKWVEMMKG